LSDGVQMGPTVGYNIDATKFISEIVDSAIGEYAEGEVLTYELYRDSSGNNSGGLFSQQVSLGSWNPCPTASIVISKIGLEGS